MVPSKYYSVPSGAFKSFIMSLPANQACDPRPDFIERGSPQRFIAAFTSQNATARHDLLKTMLGLSKPSGFSHLTSRFSSGSALMIFYLNNPEAVADPNQYALALVNNKDAGQTIVEEPPPKVMPGVKHMPSYA